MGQKMNTESAEADDGSLWLRTRSRYEAGQDSVKAIAESLGLSPARLVREAKARGWALRGRKASATQRPKDSTRATLKRFKDLLQSRLGQLESQLGDISSQVTALTSERDIRAMNTLVRTLEKVLELERKDRAHRARKVQQRRNFDDAARTELARRIEKIQGECLGPETGVEPADLAGAAPAGGLAQLGEA
jgi:flagellar motility protein MotE (MotC chaperone)